MSVCTEVSVVVVLQKESTHKNEREDCAYLTFYSKLVEQGVSITLAIDVVVVVVVVIVVVVNTDGREYNATLHANANNTLTR